MKTAALVTLLRTTDPISSQLARAVNEPDPAPGAVYLQAIPRGGTGVYPAIVVHRYNGVHDQSMKGPLDNREDNFQLDIYGDTQDTCDAVTDSCRDFLTGYTGELADGTVVEGTYLEQDRDMPYMPNASVDSVAFRSLLGFRFVSKA